VQVHFRRLYMKPGKPLNFATHGSTLIFGLPGNPVSSLVTCELFIKTAIRQMIGLPPDKVDRPTLKVTLLEDVMPSDRIEYQRGVVSVGADGRLVGRNTGSQISSRLQSFLGINALLVIAPRESVYRAGETVDAILLAPPYATDPH